MLRIRDMNTLIWRICLVSQKLQALRGAGKKLSLEMLPCCFLTFFLPVGNYRFASLCPFTLSPSAFVVNPTQPLTQFTQSDVVEAIDSSRRWMFLLLLLSWSSANAKVHSLSMFGGFKPDVWRLRCFHRMLGLSLSDSVLWRNNPLLFPGV